MTEKNPADNEQTLVEHLLELRSRLLKSLLVVLLIFMVLVFFANDLYTFFALPIQSLLPDGSTMIATEVTSPFFAPFKLTLILSAFAAAPYLLYQLWSFVAPALYSNEKRLAVPLFASSIALFYLGIAFAYYVVFPLVFGFFTSIAPEGIAVTPDINSYLSFILKLFFAFGIAFEIPIATVLVIKAGMTTRESLAKKRPYIIVMCFIFGMLLTPPDMISQSLLAIPTWLLFEMGLFMSGFIKSEETAS
ncbi:MAG: twin-arginine translocase subunit TatC [Pseudomonadales bacterium]|nr:twin-arginine translocase subunit TatC [Pseudomonadales bacterium]MDG1662231.1 twin-arginine translocase subunit TatC [Pseudomonadales bacterium]